MDTKRAKEIAESPIMADVTLNERPIYIESVNGIKQTANVHYLDQYSKPEEVSLVNLVEHKLN